MVAHLPFLKARLESNESSQAIRKIINKVQCSQTTLLQYNTAHANNARCSRRQTRPNSLTQRTSSMGSSLSSRQGTSHGIATATRLRARINSSTSGTRGRQNPGAVGRIQSRPGYSAQLTTSASSTRTQMSARRHPTSKIFD